VREEGARKEEHQGEEENIVLRGLRSYRGDQRGRKERQGPSATTNSPVSEEKIKARKFTRRPSKGLPRSEDRGGGEKVESYFCKTAN